MTGYAFDDIGCEVDDGVAVVTLARPGSHNALNTRMRSGLHRLWRAMRSDPAVRCIVLTGEGSAAFSSGIDRTEILQDDEEFDPFSYDDLAAEIGPKTNGLWKPVIAAVNGMACGGAFYLLGEADFLIAADHATFFDPHVSYGMAAVYEPMFLSGRMAFGDLMRLSLMGLDERMSAETARATGLVSEVVAGSDLMTTAMRAARSIAAHPAPPVQATVRALWSARRLGLQGAVDMGTVLLASGTRREHLDAGQERFRAAARPRPRPRTR
ncbi:enoyl-CoA hydratase/isomerase family protein [Tomitella gaofuii]|uniref:enoyl-CoA hydratase/isomerase family protein n=1 Tax=Tomitella gaofuii TaxID=2760083 RepID=UPI0015FA211D|nr:enoyl-CoA hydratase/isomerase family protein [Tomitella gaofuii]